MQLNTQIQIITNSLEVGWHQAEVMLILLKNLLFNEKNPPQRCSYPFSKASVGRTANL
jgi:hypothetical protein